MVGLSSLRVFELEHGLGIDDNTAGTGRGVGEKSEIKHRRDDVGNRAETVVIILRDDSLERDADALLDLIGRLSRSRAGNDIGYKVRFDSEGSVVNGSESSHSVGVSEGEVPVGDGGIDEKSPQSGGWDKGSGISLSIVENNEPQVDPDKDVGGGAGAEVDCQMGEADAVAQAGVAGSAGSHGVDVRHSGCGCSRCETEVPGDKFGLFHSVDDALNALDEGGATALVRTATFDGALALAIFSHEKREIKNGPGQI